MGDAITHGDRLRYRAALLQIEVEVINASIDICMLSSKQKRKEKQVKEDGGYGHGLQLIGSWSLVYMTNSEEKV